MFLFLPTPSHGGRPALDSISGGKIRFLPTPSHGGRRGMSTWRLSLTPKFLPTPSHGGRPPIVTPGTPGHNFYPRPHMEGDVGKSPAALPGIGISTHALTWRATVMVLTTVLDFSFLPTPSHGGRHTLTLYFLRCSDFYPRPHMEGDKQTSF